MIKTLVNYLKEVKMETGKVEWPGKEKVVQHTQVVIVMSLLLAGYLALSDYLLGAGLQQVLQL